MQKKMIDWEQKSDKILENRIALAGGRGARDRAGEFITFQKWHVFFTQPA